MMVLPIDADVTFGDPDQHVFKGRITAATIRKYYVIYEISYWKENEQKTIALYDYEFKVVKKIKKKEIGFVSLS